MRRTTVRISLRLGLTAVLAAGVVGGVAAASGFGPFGQPRVAVLTAHRTDNPPVAAKSIFPDPSPQVVHRIQDVYDLPAAVHPAAVAQPWHVPAPSGSPSAIPSPSPTPTDDGGGGGGDN